MTVKIGGSLGEIDADHAPNEPAAGALVARSSFTQGPYSILESTTHRYSSNLGMAHFAAGLLESGRKFLLLYSISYGLNNISGDLDTSAQAWCMQGNDVAAGRRWGYGRSHAHMQSVAVPEHMRGGHLSGFSVFTSNGETVQFVMRSPSGAAGGTANDHTAFFGGMNLVAVDISSLVQNTDYWEALPAPTIDEVTQHTAIQHLISGSEAIGDPFDVLNLQYTVPEDGLYLILAVMSGGSSVSGSTVKASLRERFNGTPTNVWEQTLRITNNNEHKTFMWQQRRGYNEGTVIDITVRGEMSSGSSGHVRRYYQPRIFIFRLNAFESHVADDASTFDVPVTATHNSYQEIASATFTPAQAEHALILGQAIVYRTTQGSEVMRITDGFDQSRIHEFCGYGNRGNTNADRQSMFCFGAPLVNFPHTYSLEVAGQPAGVGGPFVTQPRFVVIGLSPAGPITPGSDNIDIDDAPPPGSKGSYDILTIQKLPGGFPRTGLVLDDEIPLGGEGSSDELAMSVTPAAQFSIPVHHPRMWLLPSRLAYLRSRVGEAEWDYYTDDTPSSMQYSWHLVMKWKMTQNPADLTAAINRYFGSGGLMSLNLYTLTYDVDFRNYMRSMCLAYDWFWHDPVGNAAPVDALTPTQRAILKNAILCTLYAKLNPSGGSLPGALGEYEGENSNWAVSNIWNNHFFAMMLGATVAGIALEYESYPTFKLKNALVVRDSEGNVISITRYPASQWLDAGVSTYQFQIPFDNGGDEDVTPLGGAIVFYGNIFNWVKARMEVMMLPEYDTGLAGGWTDEGTNYGRQPSVNCMLEMASLMRFSAGLDYINSHPFFMDHGYFHIHAQPPGNKLLVNLGDQPTSNKALLSETDRLMAMLIADASTGYPVAQHHEFWWRTYMPLDSGDSSEYRMWVFLLHRHDRQQIDYTLDQPLSYLATGTGLWASRSSWATNALCVYMSGSYRHEEKHHSDFGALQIYHGPDPADPADGWMVLDATTWGGNKDDWPAQYHSGMFIATSALPTGWPQQRFRDMPDEAPIVYDGITKLNGQVAPGTLVSATPYSVDAVLASMNWWGRDVRSAPIHPDSNEIIANLMTIPSKSGTTTTKVLGGLHPDWGQNPYGIPYISIDPGTVALKTMFWNQHPNESDNGQPGRPIGYPMPEELKTLAGWMEGGVVATVPASDVDPGGDRHIIIIDRVNDLLYEIYKGWYNTSLSRWEGSNGACFQLRTNNRRPDGKTSADAAGLAILPGLVQYDELYNSSEPIRHATRMSIKWSDGGYVYPASHWANDDIADGNSTWGYPMGMRLVLKSSFDIDAHVNNPDYELGAQQKLGLKRLMESWKIYGFIIADRGGNGAIQGTMDSRWTSGEFNKAVRNIRFSDLDVIQFDWN